LVAGVFGLSIFFVACTSHIREAGARMIDSNKLKQIGFALHAYHDAFDHFPPRPPSAHRTGTAVELARRDPAVHRQGCGSAVPTLRLG